MVVMKGVHLTHWCTEAAGYRQDAGMTTFTPVLEFLRQAGQAQLAQQVSSLLYSKFGFWRGFLHKEKHPMVTLEA